MQKYLSNILIAAGLWSTYSCSKQLDDIVPNTQISYSQLSPSNLPMVVSGAKLALTSNNAFYLYYPHMDLLSDDVESISLTTWESLNVSPLDNVLNYMYRQPYAAIANLNMVINFGTAHAGDTSVRAAVGEAYLLRAYSYMMLSDQFGAAVLVYGNEDPKTRLPRLPVNEVQQQIEQDLLKATDILGDYTSPTSGSRQAAQLLLGRLYLNQGRNDEALTQAKAIIQSGKLSLGKNFGDIFKSTVNSTEAIYKINETATDNQYGLASFYGPGKGAGSAYSGSGNNWIDSNLVKTFESADTRRGYFLKAKGTSIVDSVYFLTKFPMEVTPSYPVCRYSEALLMAAEAAARKGNIDVTYYNMLRDARKASQHAATDFSSATAFLDEIEKERRREFVGERLRWQDMQRFGKRDDWIRQFGQPVSHALLPLPTREFQVNPWLDQNADYSK